MPRVFVANYDFEHELAAGRRELPRHVQQLAAELTTAWYAIADPEDLVWSPVAPPEFDTSELRSCGDTPPRIVTRDQDLPRGADWELVPWGWTPSLLAWGRKLGWTCPAPPLDLVREVNSRCFRWQLERSLAIEIPSSAVITSTADLVRHLEQHLTATGQWVLKANFGMSGRERVLGRGRQLDTPTANWVTKRCAAAGGVVLEPWLESVAEAGLQWEIPTQGAPRFLGLTPLLTDPAGTYRGSRLVSSPQEVEAWQPALTTTAEVARRLQQIGYHGPVGIDAMLFRNAEGEVRCRALQDLNARFTMGRLALGWLRLVPAGWQAAWLHSAELVAGIVQDDPAARVIQTSPRTWLVMQATATN